MKNTVKIIVLSLLFSCICQAKSQDYRGMLLVKSHSLTEQNDSLNVKYDVIIKRNCVESFAAMRLVPKVVASDSVALFPDLRIQGRGKQKTYDRWLKTMPRRVKSSYEAPETIIGVDNTTDTTLTFEFSVPYREWMDSAVMMFEQELIGYNDSRSVAVFALDGRVKLAPRVPYKVNPMVNFIEPAAEQKSRTKQGQAFLDFQIGKSVIVPTYRRNSEELQKIRAAFDEIIGSEGTKINGLFIEGYASPDGKFETNERLSMERATALRNYIVANFNILLTENQIRVHSVAEDWEGLKIMLQGGDIARGEEAIKIIDQTQDIVSRKNKLKNLGSAYRKMMDEVFPKLRRVEYQIDFAVKDFTIEESRNLFDKNPELLSQLELYILAQSYGEGSADFEKIMLDIIPRRYSEDVTAMVNAAAVMILRGETATAKRYLEKYAENPAIWNNLAVVYMLNGELDQAEELLNKTSVDQAKHNISEIDKKRADNKKMERYKR